MRRRSSRAVRFQGLNDIITDFDGQFTNRIAPNSLDSALVQFQTDILLLQQETSTLLTDVDDWFHGLIKSSSVARQPSLVRRRSSNQSVKSHSSLVCTEKLDLQKIR